MMLHFCVMSRSYLIRKERVDVVLKTTLYSFSLSELAGVKGYEASRFWITGA